MWAPESLFLYSCIPMEGFVTQALGTPWAWCKMTQAWTWSLQIQKARPCSTGQQQQRQQPPWLYHNVRWEMRHVRLQDVSYNESDMVDNFRMPRDLPINKFGVPCMILYFQDNAHLQLTKHCLWRALLMTAAVLMMQGICNFYAEPHLQTSEDLCSWSSSRASKFGQDRVLVSVIRDALHTDLTVTCDSDMPQQIADCTELDITLWLPRSSPAFRCAHDQLSLVSQTSTTVLQLQS